MALLRAPFSHYRSISLVRVQTTLGLPLNCRDLGATGRILRQEVHAAQGHSVATTLQRLHQQTRDLR